MHFLGLNNLALWVICAQEKHRTNPLLVCCVSEDSRGHSAATKVDRISLACKEHPNGSLHMKMNQASQTLKRNSHRAYLTA